mgnify:CR=1 FL=1
MTTENQLNVFTSLRAEAPAGGPMFADGDVAIIIKASGELKALSVGTPSIERLSLPPEQQTDFERHMVVQGRKLAAITLALGNPQIMDILYNVMDDPAVVNQDALTQVVNPN